MTPALPDPSSLLPLTPAAYHILLALAPGERHGYGIMQEIAALSAGVLRLGPGTLYSTLKRMLSDRLIEETAERPDPALDDSRRRYYALTGFGRQVLDAETARYARLVEHAQRHRAPALGMRLASAEGDA
ncbi:MAG TPA: helix-turn-helix transcriptional regulator [Herpetosiphonaceae bacterium]|nr:helix-turn-helix transcriptional regulator [Herpetosiphonaceae bacterium]